MKIMVTAFEPFGGATKNPSMEILKALPDEFEKVLLPVAFLRATEKLKSEIADKSPDFVLCLGLAGGETQTRVEKLAINYVRARIPDNDGFQPTSGKVEENGENALFTDFAVEDLVDGAMKGEIKLSVTAGTYVCNAVYYVALEKMKGKALFVHLPNTPDMGEPSLPLEQMTETVEKILGILLRSDICLSASEIAPQ